MESSSAGVTRDHSHSHRSLADGLELDGLIWCHSHVWWLGLAIRSHTTAMSVSRPALTFPLCGPGSNCSPKRIRPSERMLSKPRHKIKPRFKGWRCKRHMLIGRQAKSQYKSTGGRDEKNRHSHRHTRPCWYWIDTQSSVLKAGRDVFVALRAQDSRERVETYAK